MNSATGKSSRLRILILLAAGLVLLSAVVFLSLHLTDLEDFLELAQQAQPCWLAAALVCQLATYICAAGFGGLPCGASDTA